MDVVFHIKKWGRMAWYQLRYRINKWKEIDGIYLPVYLKYGYSVLRFIDNRSYECEEAKIVKEKLQDADVVLELGTGIGFISTLCATKVGSKKVYTFEANENMRPIIMELFRKNKVNPNFQVAYLGNNEHGFYPEDDFLASTDKRGRPKKTAQSVGTLNLNETIASVKPTYLIMDIEGNEYEVMRAIDFQTIIKVQFELHPHLLSREQVLEIFDVLNRNGFVQDDKIVTQKNLFFEKPVLKS